MVPPQSLIGLVFLSSQFLRYLWSLIDIFPLVFWCLTYSTRIFRNGILIDYLCLCNDISSTCAISLAVTLNYKHMA